MSGLEGLNLVQDDSTCENVDSAASMPATGNWPSAGAVQRLISEAMALTTLIG
jgi:hypothetical protein